MVQGPSLAAMLQGAGSMGNPQDAVREATKRAFKRGTLGNAGIADGGDGADSQLGPPGLPPHSGASGLGAMLAAVPMSRSAPGGGGQGVGGDENNIWPDGDPRNRPRRARRAPWRQRKPSFDQSPYRRA